MKSKDKLLGLVFVVAAASCWGFGGALVKLIFQGNLGPHHMVQYRLTLSAILLFFVLLLFKRSLLKLNLRDVPWFVSMGIVGLAMNLFLYYFAISKTHVAVAGFLQYLAPIIITAFSCTFLSQRFTRNIAFAILTAIAGSFLVVEAYHFNLLALNKTGVMAGVGAAISWAWWSLHAEHLVKKYHPFSLMLFSLIFASLFWSILYPPTELLKLTYSNLDILGIFYVAILATIVPFWLFCLGLQRITATSASIISTTEPIVATLSAYLLLAEELSTPQLLGAALVVAAIFILNRDKPMPTKNQKVQASTNGAA